MNQKTAKQKESPKILARPTPKRVMAICLLATLMGGSLAITASADRTDALTTRATQPQELLCGGLPSEKLVTLRVGDEELTVTIDEKSALHSVLLEGGTQGAVEPYAPHSLKFVPLPDWLGDIDALNELTPSQIWTRESSGQLPDDEVNGVILFKSISLVPGIWWITSGDGVTGGKVLATFKVSATSDTQPWVNVRMPSESESCASVEERIQETEYFLPDPAGNLHMPYASTEASGAGGTTTTQYDGTRYPDANRHYCRPHTKFSTAKAIPYHYWRNTEPWPGETHPIFLYKMYIDVTVWYIDGDCNARVYDRYHDIGHLSFSIYGPSVAPSVAGVSQWTGFGLGIQGWSADDNTRAKQTSGHFAEPFIHVQDGKNFDAKQVRHIAYPGKHGSEAPDATHLVSLALRMLRMPYAAAAMQILKYVLDEDMGPSPHEEKPGCMHACLDWNVHGSRSSVPSYFGFEASMERNSPGFGTYPVEFGAERFVFQHVRGYQWQYRASSSTALEPIQTWVPLWSS